MWSRKSTTEHNYHGKHTHKNKYLSNFHHLLPTAAHQHCSTSTPLMSSATVVVCSHTVSQTLVFLEVSAQ